MRNWHSQSQPHSPFKFKYFQVSIAKIHPKFRFGTTLMVYLDINWCMTIKATQLQKMQRILIALELWIWKSESPHAEISIQPKTR